MNSQILAAYMAAKKKEEEDEEEKKRNRHATISQEAHNNLAKKQQPQQQTTTDVFVDAGDKPQDTGDTKLTAEGDKPSRLDQANKAFQKQLQLEGDVLLTTGKKVAKDFASSVTNLDTINRTINPIKNISNINTDDLIRYANGDRDVWAQLSFSRLKSSQEARQVPFLGQIVTELAEGKYKGDAEALKDAIQRGRSSLSIQNYNKYVAPLDESISKEVSNLANQYGADKGFENFATSAGTKGLEFAGMGGLGYTPVATGVIAGSAHDTTANNFRLAQGETVSDLGRDALVNIIEGGIFGKLVGNATGSLNSGISPELKGAARYLKAGWNGFKTFAGISLATQSLDLLKSNPNFDFINWDHVEEGYKSGEYKTLQDYLNSYQFEQDVMWSRATQVAFAGLLGALSNIKRIAQDKTIGETRLTTKKDLAKLSQGRKDLTKLLGLDENATDEQIEAARTVYVKLHHPDLYQDANAKKAADEALKEFNAAYDKVMRGTSSGPIATSQSQPTSANTDIVPTTEAPSTQTYTAPSNSSVVVPPTATQMQTAPVQAPATYTVPKKDTQEYYDLMEAVKPMLDEKKIEDETLKIMDSYDDIGTFDDKTLDKIDREATKKVFDEFLSTDMGKRVATSYKNGELQPLEATEEDYSGGYTALDGTPITNGIAKWAEESTTKEDGKLVPYYHGSPFLFEEFKDTYTHNGKSLGDGYYLTKNEKRAKDTYAYDDKDKVYKLIVNAKNPFNDDAWARDKEEIISKVPELVEEFDKEGIKNTKFVGGKADYIEEMKLYFDEGKEAWQRLEGEPDADNTIELVKDIAKRNGIDTRDIWKWLGYDGIQDGEDIVIFDSNQAKYLDNPNPTKDTRFGYFSSNQGKKLTRKNTSDKIKKNVGGAGNGDENRKILGQKDDRALWEKLGNGSGTDTSKFDSQLWQRQTSNSEEIEKKLTLVNDANLNEAQKEVQSSFRDRYGISVKYFSNDMRFWGCATSEGIIYLSSAMSEQELRFVSQHELAEETLLKASKESLKKFDDLITLSSINKFTINRYVEEFLAPKGVEGRENIIDYYKAFPKKAAKEAVCDMCGYSLLNAKSEYAKALRRIFGDRFIATVKAELDKIINETDFAKKDDKNSEEGSFSMPKNLPEKPKGLRKKEPTDGRKYLEGLTDKQITELEEIYKGRKYVAATGLSFELDELLADNKYLDMNIQTIRNEWTKLREKERYNFDYNMEYRNAHQKEWKELKKELSKNHLASKIITDLWINQTPNWRDKDVHIPENASIKSLTSGEPNKFAGKKEPAPPKKQEAKVEETASKEERKKALKDKLRELAARLQEEYGNMEELSKEEAEQFFKLNKEISDIKYDLEKNYYQDISEKNIKDERLTSLDKNVYVQARKDLLSNKDIYDAIEEASFGVFFNSDTAVDDIMEGKNKKVTAEELYNTFSKTRELLRKQYGDTITLYRVEGLQKPKATKNYGSSLAYTKQYGPKVNSYNIKVKDIIAINTNRNGTYEDIIVASNGIDNYLKEETKSEPPKKLEPPKKKEQPSKTEKKQPAKRLEKKQSEPDKRLGFDAVDKEKETLEKANNELRDKLAKQEKEYEKKLAKKDNELAEFKQKKKEQDLKRKARLAKKETREKEEKRFKSATPKGKLRILGRKIEKQTGYYEINNFPELDETYEREFGKTIRQTIETLYKREVFPYLPAKMQDVVNTFRDETYLKANWKTFDKYLREALEIKELEKLIGETDTTVAEKLLERIKVHKAAPITIKTAKEMYDDLQLLQDIVEAAEERMSYRRVNEEVDKALNKASVELEELAKKRPAKETTKLTATTGKIENLKEQAQNAPQWLKTAIQAVMGGNPDSGLKIIWDWFAEGNEKYMELSVKFARNFTEFVEKAPGGWKLVPDLDKDFAKDAKPIDTGITGSAPNGKKYGENAKLTKDIIMHIVASSKNQDNLMSFSKVLLGTDYEGKPVYSKPGGYVVPNQYFLDKGKIEEAYSKGKKYVFTMDEIKHLESLLTDTEKKFVEAALNVGKITAKEGNEVSQKLIGRDIFTVDNYIRIIRDPNTLNQDLIDPSKLDNLSNALSNEFVGLEGILGRGGSLEARNHRSSRPIYGESLRQSVTNSFRGATKYISYAIPLYDTDMLMNSRLPDTFEKIGTQEHKPRSTQFMEYVKVDELPRNSAPHTRYYIDNGNGYDIYEMSEQGKSLQQLIRNAGGEKFFDYYKSFTSNLIGQGRKYSPISSLRAKVVLNANLRVAATQFFSYFQMGQFLEHPISSMAKGIFDKKYIYLAAKEFLEGKGEDLTGLDKRGVINKMWEEVTFLNTFRGLGYTTDDISYIEAGSSLLGRVNSGRLMKAVDRFTVDATFRALAEDLIAQGYKFGTPEFFNAYKQNLFAIYQSNPQYARIYKTPLQNDYGAISTALSQFNTVMIEGYNNALQAAMAREYYKANGDKANQKKWREVLTKSLLGLAAGGALLVLMKDAHDRIAGKKNDESYGKKILLDWIQNVLSYTIIGDEIFAALINRNDYDITTNELSYAQNALDTLGYYGSAITSGKPSEWIKAIKGSLNVAGIPANGIENIMSMIGNATNSKTFKAYSVLKNKNMYEQYLKNEDLIDGDIATFYDMKQVMTEKALTEDYGYIKGSKAKTYNSKGSAKARAIRDVLGFPKDGALTEEQSKEYNKWYEVFKNS